jgi:RNA polymerase sigma-70 factor (ECF subfamily)
LRNSEDAEEVVCDTFAQAWSQSEKFDSDLASPIGWLMMMCRTRAIDRLRQNSSRRSPTAITLRSAFGFVDEPLSPDELLSLFQSNSRVRQTVEALRPQRLQLVGLAFFEGLTFTEVAQRVGMPLGTVKSHIRRALAELRGTMGLYDL